MDGVINYCVGVHIMKVIEVSKLFTPMYLDSLKRDNQKFLGEEKCRIINGKQYIGLITAQRIGYHIMDNWIEELSV